VRRFLGVALLILALVFVKPAQWLLTERRAGSERRAGKAPTRHDLLLVERAAERRRRRALRPQGVTR
jgi:hypothetical protein